MRKYRYNWWQQGLNNEGKQMVMPTKSHGRVYPVLHKQTNFSQEYYEKKEHLGLSMTILETAERDRQKIKDRLNKIWSKSKPLEKELEKLNAVIKLLNPETSVVQDAENERTVIFDKPEIKYPPVSDMIRGYAAKNKDGFTQDQFTSIIVLAYPECKVLNKNNIYQALYFLVSNSELEKLGQGSMAKYKPTDTLREVKL
jgi:hypothetical protein